MLNQTVGHYEILDQLGQGGMGIVYKARDTKLDRFVALKFLPPHLSGDPESNARFVQEAKAASALDHPNICTIYEIGETDDGQLFISMPFYDGETLKYRLKSGAMPVDQALAIARGITLGLGRAHEAGIVHRDVKPANIMVTDRGEVKVLDFGIAKLEQSAGLTQTGSTLGTIAYMSPEQSTGGETDRRSDLWAVGVLLYEMLAGERPFTGQYDQAVVYAILNQEPKSLSESGHSIPTWLSNLVAKLLSKDPSDRFQNAAELVEALSGPTAEPNRVPHERPAFTLGKSVWYGVALLLVALLGIMMLRPIDEEPERMASADVKGVQAPDIATLAVLPFSNLRSDPETDFLGFALADQVIGSLTYIQNLTVRPAGSVRQYQDGDYDIQQAGLSLGADYVMAGNYLQQDDRMRLTVELVDIQSQEMIWREPIDLEYDDVFSLQDIVAERLLKRLEVQFSDAERVRMRADVPADPVAYEYYLRALTYPEDRDGNEFAIELLRKATTLDSTYAPAWNALGGRLRTSGYWDLGGKSVAEQARDCYQRAIELNPDLLSALSNVSLFHAETGEIDRAYEAAERVLEINPNHAEGHFARGYVLRYAGMIEESAEEMRRAIAADSTNPIFRSAGFTFIASRDTAEALRAFSLSRVPGLVEGWTGIFRGPTGQEDEVIGLLSTARDYDSTGVVGLWTTAIIAGWEGDYDDGVAAARKWESANLLDGEGRYFLATMFCLNREYERCIELLNESVDSGYYNYHMYLVDSFLDGARNLPGFKKVFERAKQRSKEFRKRHFGQ